jgi:hypothetical protein
MRRLSPRVGPWLELAEVAAVGTVGTVRQRWAPSDVIALRRLDLRVGVFRICARVHT